MTVLMECENISKEYGKRIILDKINFKVSLGERLGIVGDNGAGKTTLANILSGRIEADDGKVVWYKQGVTIGYMKQATEYEELKDTLSGGERTRKLLTEVLYGKYNFIILDEPTNHIDLHVREQLEEALAKYNGTIILVTHDRYMLEKICNKLLIFENKSIKRCEYGFAEYLDKKKEQAENNANKKLAEEKIILDNKLAYIIGQLSTLNKESQEYKKLAEEYTEILKLKRIYS